MIDLPAGITGGRNAPFHSLDIVGRNVQDSVPLPGTPGGLHFLRRLPGVLRRFAIPIEHRQMPIADVAKASSPSITLRGHYNLLGPTTQVPRVAFPAIQSILEKTLDQACKRTAGIGVAPFLHPPGKIGFAAGLNR